MNISALNQLSYGLYVVGVQGETGFAGSIVDAVAQVGAGDAPLIAVSCMKKNYTPERIKATGEFTLSILSEAVDPFVIANFGFQSARVADKWANVPHELQDGLPILTQGASAYIRCRVTETKELPTHTLFLVEATDAWQPENPAPPIIYANYRRDMATAAREAFEAHKKA